MQVNTSYLVAKTLSSYAIILLAIVTLIVTTLVAIATVVARSMWWQRLGRSHVRSGNRGQMRMSELGYTCARRAVNLFAIGRNIDTDHQPDPVATRSVMENTAFPRRSACSELSGRTQTLPLRFQPEKLYGATSSKHRDNLRKKSWACLPVVASDKVERKTSVIDSLLQRGSTRNTWADLENLEKGLKPSAKEVRPAPALVTLTAKIPRIQLMCEKDDAESHSDDSVDANDYDCQDEVTEGKSCLGVTVATRRASSSKMELASSWMDASTSRAFGTPQYSPTCRRKDRSCDRLFVEKDPLTFVKRNSLILDSMMLKSNSASSTANVLGRRSLDASKSDLLVESVSAMTRRLSENPMEMSADLADGSIGRLQVGIKYYPTRLEVHFTGVDSLASPRPWRRSSLNFKCCLTTLAGTSSSVWLKAKNVEFTQMTVTKFSEAIVSLHLDGELRKEEGMTSSIGDLRIDIYEQSQTWTSGKDFYHGFVKLTIDPYLEGERTQEGVIPQPIWHQIETIYPPVHLTGDILVSVAQRRMEGIVSVGVHELRNLGLRVRDPKVSPTELFESGEYPISVHVCLTQSGRLVNSKKQTSLDCTVSTSPSFRSPRETTMAVDESSRWGLSKTRVQHLIQFPYPNGKKSMNRQLLSEFGLIIYTSASLPFSSHLPVSTGIVNQLKSMNIATWKRLTAIGRCAINYQDSQKKRFPQFSEDNTLSPLEQSNSLWNESMRYDGSRVYQWLSLD